MRPIKCLKTQLRENNMMQALQLMIFNRATAVEWEGSQVVVWEEWVEWTRMIYSKCSFKVVKEWVWVTWAVVAEAAVCPVVSHLVVCQVEWAVAAADVEKQEPLRIPFQFLTASSNLI